MAFSSPPPSPQIPLWERIFIGPRGLRAGWRLLLFVVLITIAEFVLVHLLRHLPLPKTHGPLGLMTMEATLLAGVVLATLLMARLDGCSWGRFGLPAAQAFGRLFWRGAVWGLVALSVLLLVLRGLHHFYFGTLVLHGEAIWRYGAIWALTFLTVALFEDTLFRGYALVTLAGGMGFWPAALLLSALFGAVHVQNGGENWLGAASAGLIGLFFCLTVRRTGTLWFALGFHAAWDWAETFLYSTPDSGLVAPGHLLNSSFNGPTWLTGGSVGPEGSALVFLLIALLFLAFHLRHRRVADVPR